MQMYLSGSGGTGHKLPLTVDKDVTLFASSLGKRQTTYSRPILLLE